MVTRHERGKVTWIDIESPNPDELREVMEEFQIDTHIQEEIRLPTPYPIFMDFPQYLYLVLHFPTTLTTGGARDQEIDFIIGKKFLITIRYDVIESIHNLHKVFEAEELLGLPKNQARADILFERVFRRLYAAIRYEVEHAARRLDHIENAIFAGHERETVREISQAGSILLRFETTVGRHEEPLAKLLERLSSPTYFGAAFKKNAAHIEAERLHAGTLISSYRATAIELRNTNDSILSATQNEIMKNLTIITFIVMPLTLLAGIFNMGAKDTPIIGMPGDFWIIIGIMLVCSGIVGAFVLRRRWL